MIQYKFKVINNIIKIQLFGIYNYNYHEYGIYNFQEPVYKRL